MVSVKIKRVGISEGYLHNPHLMFKHKGATSSQIIVNKGQGGQFILFSVV